MCPDLTATLTFTDINGDHLLQLRVGLQDMAPPSVHPDTGERLTWDGLLRPLKPQKHDEPHTPVPVSADTLIAATRLAWTARLISKYGPLGVATTPDWPMPACCSRPLVFPTPTPSTCWSGHADLAGPTRMVSMMSAEQSRARENGWRRTSMPSVARPSRVYCPNGIRDDGSCGCCGGVRKNGRPGGCGRAH